MLIDLKRTSRPSKIQPKIFSIFKEMQSEEENYLVILDQNNKPMGAIVSPQIIEKHLKDKIKQKAYQSDDLKDFYQLSEKSFEFWNNQEDDIYENYYQ